MEDGTIWEGEAGDEEEGTRGVKNAEGGGRRVGIKEWKGGEEEGLW